MTAMSQKSKNSDTLSGHPGDKSILEAMVAEKVMKYKSAGWTTRAGNQMWITPKTKRAICFTPLVAPHQLASVVVAAIMAGADARQFAELTEPRDVCLAALRACGVEILE